MFLSVLASIPERCPKTIKKRRCFQLQKVVTIEKLQENTIKTKHVEQTGGTNRPGTRIFSPLAVAGLYVTIGSLLVSIPAFNGATLSLHFPIPTHSYKWFIQSTFKAGRRSVIRAAPLCALIALRRDID